MRKLTLLTVLVGMMLALSATVALAAVINGTARDDRLRGTNQADRITASAGNDFVFGLGGNDFADGGRGNDFVYGAGGNDNLTGAIGDDLVSGSTGNDTVIGGLSRDDLQGAAGDDILVAQGDPSPDNVSCGGGFDEARVSLNDLLGGESVSDVLQSTTTVEQDALSCEVLVINGFRIPLGAIVALPAGVEAQVSLLLEEFLRDGELSPDEIADLQDVFDLLDEDPPFSNLRNLLDDLLGVLG